jgi:hypothetical protein
VVAVAAGAGDGLAAQTGRQRRRHGPGSAGAGRRERAGRAGGAGRGAPGLAGAADPRARSRPPLRHADDVLAAPASQARRDELAIGCARDGYALLEAVCGKASPAWLREFPAVDVLRRVLLQDCTRTITSDGREVIKRREKEPGGDGLPPGHMRIASPCGTDARWGAKREESWLGCKLHVTEACDDAPPCNCRPGTPAGPCAGDAMARGHNGGEHGNSCAHLVFPNLVTHVATTDATVTGNQMTGVIHDGIARRNLMPGRHYADSGYLSAAVVAAARQAWSVALTGPLLAGTSAQARAGNGHARAGLLRRCRGSGADEVEGPCARREAAGSALPADSPVPPAAGASRATTATRFSVSFSGCEGFYRSDVEKLSEPENPSAKRRAPTHARTPAGQQGSSPVSTITPPATAPSQQLTTGIRNSHKTTPSPSPSAIQAGGAGGRGLPPAWLAGGAGGRGLPSAWQAGGSGARGLCGFPWEGGVRGAFPPEGGRRGGEAPLGGRARSRRRGRPLGRGHADPAWRGCGRRAS